MPPLVKRRTPVLEPVGSHKLVKVPEKELDPEFLMKDPEFVKKYEAMEARHGIDRPELEDPRVMSVLMAKLGWQLDIYEFKKK
mmetsp:Transcript_48259/g.108702  ORF Transcript_48259/g.108702 Transcript_48259/m.108702 type:complete len:83 (-) Transcript_48259:335-583(-)|eukprot:CAMPEP_0181220468 /NCGR_PEP_ID=MMETSP1096-20121128/28855_1 /TAXON_ID=156174 ORGANISM="Chrysochromulina ericina, Strain CCMP281" /NCGR_SAMPLE_ID=MMETSP1096 /ASSEMBLY_ACC=CAM_ASM_000453 /LENGTH=82 /DNA_ID=CAMNT_0023312977 /DNA_START=117 /DNA_END=365 /DNA_ORIENTATION=+